MRVNLKRYYQGAGSVNVNLLFYFNDFLLVYNTDFKHICEGISQISNFKIKKF